jgi:hypothetical protein
MATSFSGGRSRSTRRETPTIGKQLVNFITYVCESSAPFFNTNVYTVDIIHLLHAGEGNMKIYSPKSVLVGEYIFIFPEPACYKCFIIPNEIKKTHTCKILLANIV